MQAISIITKKYTEDIGKKLKEQFILLQEDGIEINISENTDGDYTFFSCQSADTFLSHYTFIYYIANVISEFIVDDLESTLLKKIINNNCNSFLAEEKETILQNASQTLQGTNREKYFLPAKERKKQVFQLVLEYLENYNLLIIEGFLRFRLRDYYSQLEEIVTHGIESYVMEKEYREFIRLLRYFVEMQEPRLDEVHVLWNSGKSFQVLDGQGQKINNDLLEDFALDLFDEGIDQGDLLVSTLITISPLRIVLHSKEQREIVETIKSIFTTRVRVCSGCKLCGLLDSSEKRSLGELVTSGLNFSGGKEKN